MNILVPLAEGFEEIEAVTIIDVLRRADIKVTTAYIDKNPVTGSHDIPVTADIEIKTINESEISGIVLPGGMPGSDNLKKNNKVIELVKKINLNGGLTGAICAAPIVLGHAGLLHGKKATCYPGFEEHLKGAIIVKKGPVVTDGNIITARGPGCAMAFALEIIASVNGEDQMTRLKNSMQVYWM